MHKGASIQYSQAETRPSSVQATTIEVDTSQSSRSGNDPSLQGTRIRGSQLELDRSTRITSNSQSIPITYKNVLLLIILDTSTTISHGDISHRPSRAGLPTSHDSSPTYINEHDEAYEDFNYPAVPLTTMVAAGDSGSNFYVPSVSNTGCAEAPSSATETLLDNPRVQEPTAQVPQTNSVEPESRSTVQTRRRTRASTVKERHGGSAPLKPLEPVSRGVVQARRHTRTSTTKACHADIRARRRTRTSTTKERRGNAPLKPRKRPNPGLGVVIEGEYEIQRIIDHRSTSHGDEYKVVWADTWVTADDLGGARKALQDFKKERSRNISKTPVRNRKSGISCVPSKSFLPRKCSM